MYRTRNILIIMLAAACVISGALLPLGSSVLQDHQLRQRDETRTIDTVQLLLRQKLTPAQTLTLLSEPYAKISWDSSTRLTPQEAEALISGVLWDMMQIGLIPEQEAFQEDSKDWDIETQPALIISEQDSRMSVLLWECVWKNAGGAVYTVWIDDTTGLVCGVRGLQQASIDSASAALKENLVRWSEFLMKCCGMYAMSEEIIASDNGQITVKLTLSSMDDSKDTCTAILTINDTDFSFVI